MNDPLFLTPEQVEDLAERLRKIMPALVRFAARLKEDFDLWEQEMSS